MKNKDIKGFIESMIDKNSKNLEIRKSIWNKELDTDIYPRETYKPKKISKEQEFIIKLIFYLNYISINNLKAILSPLMNSSQVEYILDELKDSGFLECKKRGYYGSFYYLTHYGLEKVTGLKSEGKYPLTNISNCTLESQDYRHIYLVELVIQRVLARLNSVYNSLTSENREGYITTLFIKNISFDLMMKRPDRTAYLKSIGYTSEEIVYLNSLKSYYLEKERVRYTEKVLAAKAEVLGKDKYFKAYKRMFNETKDTFGRYNLLHDLIRNDLRFNYFDCIKKTIYDEINKGGKICGKRHNLIFYQTEDIRQGIYTFAQLVAKANGIKEPQKPSFIMYDRLITEYLEVIRSRNAICNNLRKNLKKGAITAEEVPYYNELMEHITEQKKLREEAQENYHKNKIYVTFTDSKAKMNAEDRPIITLYELSRRNVFIGDVAQKVDSKGKYFLDITVVKIDRNKDLKNFKSSGLRRDYFGVCEKLKSIGDEMGITVNVNYIYCYPKGSTIVGYEERFKKIFDNGGTSNSNMIGADRFIVKELKPYIPIDKYMEQINKMIIF